MGNYFQKEIECASADQIRAWQNERLVKQVKNIYDNVPYYRTRMQVLNQAILNRLMIYINFLLLQRMT